jgi:NADP-dependent 3-hydroxy acid dehydrogenase YdfG
MFQSHHPQMIERKSGHIINIGSTAGKEVYPNGNVYCATKHAVAKSRNAWI